VNLGEALVSSRHTRVYGDSMVDHEPILMCASCWRIQPLEDDLSSEPDRWIDPTTFMACGQLRSHEYEIIDGYCDPCLMEIALRDHHALVRAAGERTNA